jgi:hypothetical protein
MTDQIRQKIEFSLDIFQEFPKVSDKLLVDKLITKNISQQDSWKLIFFVPLAFNRILMSSSGVTFSNKYTIEIKGKSSSTNFLKDEPFFQQTINIAMSQSKYCQEYWTNIISRSVELKAINQALYAGSNIEDLLLSPPVLALPIEN